MIRPWHLLCLLAVAAAVTLAGVAGCGSGVKERTIEVPQVSPAERAKMILQGYVNGQPVGSEMTEFDFLIRELQKTDPGRADTLKRGLDEMKRSPAGSRSRAKDLLSKL